MFLDVQAVAGLCKPAGLAFRPVTAKCLIYLPTLHHRGSKLKICSYPPAYPWVSAGIYPYPHPCTSPIWTMFGMRPPYNLRMDLQENRTTPERRRRKQ